MERGEWGGENTRPIANTGISVLMVCLKSRLSLVLTDHGLTKKKMTISSNHEFYTNLISVRSKASVCKWSKYPK